MNWDKAKNITLIFLIILNIFLGALVYLNSSLFKLSSAEERDVLNILTKNNISLSSGIIKSYKPMANISAYVEDIDANELVNLLFNNNLDTQLIKNENIIKNNTEILTKNNNSFIYETHLNSNNVSATDAKKTAILYLEKIKSIIPNLDLDTYKINNNQYIFEYIQKYKGNTIKNNCVIIIIDKNGSLNLELTYLKPLSYERFKNKIQPSNKALLVLLKYLNEEFGNKKIIIDKFNIIYFFNDLNDKSTRINLTPYYRFSIDSYNKEYLIDCYTLELIVIDKIY